METSSLGKGLVIIGLLIAGIGGLLWLFRGLPLNLDNCPAISTFVAIAGHSFSR
jgi:hypothetical protein